MTQEEYNDIIETLEYKKILTDNSIDLEAFDDYKYTPLRIDKRQAIVECLATLINNMPDILKYSITHYIPANMFTGTPIEKINIPNNIRKISVGAFEHCDKLEEVNFDGDSVIEIDKNVFYGCERLKYIHLPKSLKRIGEGVFSNIEVINIPKNIEFIHEKAFKYCNDSLKVIMINSIKPQVYSSQFYDLYNLKDIYYVGNENQWEEFIKEKNIKFSPYAKIKIHYNCTFTY